MIGCVIFASFVLLATFLVHKCYPKDTFRRENRLVCNPRGMTESMLPCGFWRHRAFVLSLFLLLAVVEAFLAQLLPVFVHLGLTFVAVIKFWICLACTSANPAATICVFNSQFMSSVCAFAPLTSLGAPLQAFARHFCIRMH